MMDLGPYFPVNCEFHDRLLDFTTRQVVVHVELKGDRQIFAAKIKDVFTREGAEYIFFDNGDTYRLDELESANGYRSIGGVCVAG